jgi:hypothetical protein
MSESKPVPVLSCTGCNGPVMQNAGSCASCGTPVSGREFPYAVRLPSGPDIPGMCKWWAIWCAGIWALSGFSFGIGSSLAVTAVSLVYVIRILRAYYG